MRTNRCKPVAVAGTCWKRSVKKTLGASKSRRAPWPQIEPSKEEGVTDIEPENIRNYPWKTYMDPENHWFVEENSLSGCHSQGESMSVSSGSMLVFRSVVIQTLVNSDLRLSSCRRNSCKTFQHL